MQRHAGVALALLAVPAMARAQMTAGPEFRVNAFTTNTQQPVSAASLRGGDFVVVLNSYGQDGSSLAAVGDRFSAGGARLGAEFVVNTYTAGQQVSAFDHAAGGDRSGRYVIAWSSAGQDGSGLGVFAQRFAPSGARLGAEFQVNTYTTGSQVGPQTAVAADGSFVVVWSGYGAGSNSSDILARRFDAAGTPRGPEFRVNTYTTGSQATGKVVGDASGRFVVMWLGEDGNSAGVIAQRFDAAGAPIGGEFIVNTTTPRQQPTEGAAQKPPRAMVVVWRAPDGDGYGIFARRFNSALSPVGAEFRANLNTAGDQTLGTAAIDDAGNFVVAWGTDTPGDGGPGTEGTLSVNFQRFFAFGARRGNEFRANSFTTGDQRNPVVTSDAVGNFVVAWTSGTSSGNQDGSASGGFGQRFGGLLPAALAVSDNGNGVLEVGDDFSLLTAWRNVNGATQSFSSQATSFTGPPGPFYTLTNVLTSYGTVANGATGGCLAPCLAASLQGTRPAGHVDAFLQERISPDEHGQDQRWVLHVGDSFADVPRSNVFYRFVETLLHHSITGGCAAGQYCPGSSTTREQMSVFVLVAKEGAGYQPPSCTTPVFGDVPAASPFCRWIEELSRRGVVGGCGGGNYCPADAVTREQMAVFVLRTLDPLLNPPACTTPVFPDVPAASPFCRWIEELARRGVVTGCGGGNYCPGAAVTREQMGVFISSTFGLTLYGP